MEGRSSQVWGDVDRKEERKAERRGGRKEEVVSREERREREKREDLEPRKAKLRLNSRDGL